MKIDIITKGFLKESGGGGKVCSNFDQISMAFSVFLVVFEW